MSWINKILDPLNFSPWKTLFLDQYTKFGGDKIWLMNLKSLQIISANFNKFWKDIFQNWGKLLPIIEADMSPNTILSQAVWFHEKIKVNNKIIFYEKWCDAGLFFINDLLNENDAIMSYEEFNRKYNIRTNYLLYYGVIQAIPKSWKDKIKNSKKLPVVTNKSIEFVKTNKKSCQYFYNIFLSLISKSPVKQQEKWQTIFDHEFDNWEQIYQTAFQCTKNNRLIIFQYKILNRTLSTNSFLYKCKLKETHLCSFCGETKESILHLFWECATVKTLWLEFQDLLYEKCDVSLPLAARYIIMGLEDYDPHNCLNYCIILIKYYIYSCRFTSNIPCLHGAINILKKFFNIEKLSTSFYRSPAAREKILLKWDVINTIIEQ